jgi:hypothetical protein
MGMTRYFVFLILTLVATSGAISTSETSNLGISKDDKNFHINAHYSDRSRTNLVIEGTCYTINVFVPQAKITSVKAGNRQIAELGYLWVKFGGKVYRTDRSDEHARLNIWRHGPYYYEIHIMNCRLVSEDGTKFPGFGEMVFYSYPEKCHVQAVIHASSDVDIEAAGFELQLIKGIKLAGEEFGTVSTRIFQIGSKEILAVVSPALIGDGVGVSIPAGIYKKDSSKYGWLALLPAGMDDSVEFRRRIRNEVNPLVDKHFTPISGGVFEGYDRVRGHYVIRTTPGLSTYSFESAWVSPNEYLAVNFRVKNDSISRRIYIKHYTCNLGGLEAGVVADKHGFPLPIPVQVCKNFAGEGEEPDDTAFGESYFPLSLQPNQSLDLRSYHLLMNWGNHPLKQVSSIRFFEHYYHLSTGVTETTCYVPFTKFAYPSAGYTIADFRGMSGITWLGQPQHHHVALIGFLQYYDGEWHYLRYLNTHFDYISPNLAKFSMNYVSDDNKVKATVQVMEIPQTDETRSFVRLRYEVIEPVRIQGDPRRNLRFLLANTDITRNDYQKVAYLDADNKVAEVPLRYDDSWLLEGVPLGTEHPFICMYASDKGNNSFIVRRYEGRINGKPLERLGISAIGYTNHVAEQFLTIPSIENNLLPGDYIDVDVILMPYGFDWDDWRRPNRERTYYGFVGPKARAIHGEKLGDFPAEVKAADGYAEFEISGGHDYLPLIVKGMPHYNAPMLWEYTGHWNFINQQVRGNDWYQVVVGDEGFDFVFLVKQRNGMAHRYLVTQAWSESGIRSVESNNGEVIVTSEKIGRIEILSPRLFSKLKNYVKAGESVIRSVGVAQKVVTVPIMVVPEGGAVTVTVDGSSEEGYVMALEGQGKVSVFLEHLGDSAEFDVQIGKSVQRLKADRVGSAKFSLDVQGKTAVSVRLGH